MADHSYDLQHDIELLRRAIEISSEAATSSLLSEAERVSVRDDIAAMEQVIEALTHQLDRRD